MKSVCINATFIFNYYKFNTFDIRSITFKACLKRFDLKSKNSNNYKIQIVMSTRI